MWNRAYVLLQVGEGRLQQVGDVLLDVRLVVGRAGGAQRHADLPLLHQVEHVGQDGGVHGQPCGQAVSVNYLFKAFSAAQRNC